MADISRALEEGSPPPPLTDGVGHWIPQYLYTIDAQQEQTICKAENVLRFEGLSVQFDGLIRRYNLPTHISLRSSGSSSSGSSSDRGHETVKIGVGGQPVQSHGGEVHQLNNDAIKTFFAADLNKENVDLIRLVYARDFQQFGYELDVPPRPALRVKLDAGVGAGAGAGAGAGGKKRGRSERDDAGAGGTIKQQKHNNKINTKSSISSGDGFQSSKANAGLSMAQLMAKMKQKK